VNKKRFCDELPRKSELAQQSDKIYELLDLFFMTRLKIMLPMTDRTVLRPVLTELQAGDKHLAEMQRYLRHLVAVPDKEAAAHNASLAYLAMMHAFAEEGLLQLAWAPRLVIDIGDQEYGVRPQMGQNTLISRKIVLEGSVAGPEYNSEVDTRSQRSDDSPSRLVDPVPRAGRGTSKLSDLLDGLETCALVSPVMSPTHPREDFYPSETISNGTSEPPRDATGDVAMPSLSHAQGILDSLRGIDRLDGQVLGLSVATNFAYWKLGRTYESFCEVSRSLR
jgi:hypothetical protein